jgi:hypothetical protein
MLRTLSCANAIVEANRHDKVKAADRRRMAMLSDFVSMREFYLKCESLSITF